MAVTVTKKRKVPTDRRKKEALDKIDMLEGKPPHNTWSNICYGDGYFAASIKRDYGPEARADSIEGIKAWCLS